MARANLGVGKKTASSRGCWQVSQSQGSEVGGSVGSQGGEAGRAGHAGLYAGVRLESGTAGGGCSWDLLGLGRGSGRAEGGGV